MPNKGNVLPGSAGITSSARGHEGASDGCAVNELRPVFIPGDLKTSVRAREQSFTAGHGLQDGWEAARRYVLEMHPNSSCTLVVGSYARAEATHLSDVDIFIVDDQVNSPFLVQRVFDGFPIQASTFNGLTAWRLIDVDYQAGSHYLVEAFAKAKCLCGSRELAEALTRRGMNLLKQGPPPYSQRQVASCRATIVNQLLKVAKHASCPVTFDACSKLIDSFGRYLQLIAGHWLVGDAPFDPFLRNSPEYQSAVGAIPSALAGDSVPLIRIIVEALSAAGEVRWSTDPSAPLPLGR